MLKKTIVATVLAMTAAAHADDAAIKERLRALVPEMAVQGIESMPIPGISEITFTDGGQAYMTDDGKYLLSGIVDLNTNLPYVSEAKKKSVQETMAKIGDDKAVIFGTGDKMKYSVTVFSDVDCGYCRFMHSEVQAYNDKGIQVRYLLMPRAEKGSDSYKKSVSVWCAEDRNAALTKAKLGEEIEARTCDTPIEEIVALGKSLGVHGTPTIVLPDGTLSPGYMQPEPLLKALSR